MPDWRERTGMLLGDGALGRLEASHMIVFGLGGVGSYAAEALARAGVGALTLVDPDCVGESNLNRQLVALRSALGRPKAELMAERVRDINPDCRVQAIVGAYHADTRERFWTLQPDYVLDAIDLVSCKIDMILTAQARGLPMISALGTGNRLDASRFRVCDLSETYACRLARVLRRELRARGVTHARVVWSDETPASPLATEELPPPGRRSIPASVSWVPGVAGLLMAGEAVRHVTGAGRDS